jgi:hypothetical protein
MYTLNKLLWVAALSTMGCTSDYKLAGQVEKTEPGITAPEIEVDPISHDFGALNAGYEISDLIVTIENIGNGDLDIGNIYLHSGNSNFSLTSVPTGIVESSDSVDLIVTYSPGTYEFNSDEISILSNDEDEPEVIVLLDGSGDAPVIRITPDYYDFGSVYVGCDSDLEIFVENIGNASLEITDVEYFSTLPVDFSLSDYESDHGPLPWTLSPGTGISLFTNYIPVDLLDDSAYVEITSSDPRTPVIESAHDAIGDYESWLTDEFIQDGESIVDIVFVIDNSGSMYSNQTNLKNNFDTFVGAFTSAGVDYHLALITTDDAAFVGDVISPSTPDPISEFNDQIDSIGITGSPLEQGLYYSYLSTMPGGDASPTSSTGFLRETARLVVVYVSDEPDISSRSSTMTTSDYSAHLLSLKSSSELVVAHAIAGDFPSGCTSNGGAQFGDGYYDVVTDLGGTFMSICASDWSTTMDTLARESMARMSFELSDTPIEDTLSVTVDGYAVTDSSWSYDSTINSIIFSVAPGDESEIDVTYAILAVCESE